MGGILARDCGPNDEGREVFIPGRTFRFWRQSDDDTLSQYQLAVSVVQHLCYHCVRTVYFGL